LIKPTAGIGFAGAFYLLEESRPASDLTVEEPKELVPAVRELRAVEPVTRLLMYVYVIFSSFFQLGISAFYAQTSMCESKLNGIVLVNLLLNLAI
jgi:hypothetical protein